jgi:predicted  nucleic acid-binding Zn-ribbon protein
MEANNEKDVFIVNKHKCYNCGKVFRDNSKLNMHKKRRSPCLIVEVDPQNEKNPNRCIYCNKIFARKDNLTRHGINCKIKNGGMKILIDKVKHDEYMKNQEENVALKNRIEQLEKEAAEIRAKPVAQTIITNTANDNRVINNINNQTINNQIIINGVFAPNTAYITKKIYTKIIDHLGVQTPTTLISLVWCNPHHPDNFSVYVINKTTREVLFFDGTKWVTDDFNAEFGAKIRNFVYDLAMSLFDQYQPKISGGRDIRERLAVNKTNIDSIEYDNEQVYARILSNRALFTPGPPGSNSITVLGPVAKVCQ